MTPIYRSSDNELLGFIEEISGIWQIYTIFKYKFAEAKNRTDAENILQEKGFSILNQNWEFFNLETKDWERCILLEISQSKIKIAEYSGIYPDMNKTKIFHTSEIELRLE